VLVNKSSNIRLRGVDAIRVLPEFLSDVGECDVVLVEGLDTSVDESVFGDILSLGVPVCFVGLEHSVKAGDYDLPCVAYSDLSPWLYSEFGVWTGFGEPVTYSPREIVVIPKAPAVKEQVAPRGIVGKPIAARAKPIKSSGVKTIVETSEVAEGGTLSGSGDDSDIRELYAKLSAQLDEAFSQIQRLERERDALKVSADDALSALELAKNSQTVAIQRFVADTKLEPDGRFAAEIEGATEVADALDSAKLAYNALWREIDSRDTQIEVLTKSIAKRAEEFERQLAELRRQTEASVTAAVTERDSALSSSQEALNALEIERESRVQLLSVIDSLISALEGKVEELVKAQSDTEAVRVELNNSERNRQILEAEKQNNQGIADYTSTGLSDIENASFSAEAYRLLQVTNDTLAKQVNSTQLELAGTQSRLTDAQEKAQILQRENDNLKVTAKAMSGALMGGAASIQSFKLPGNVRGFIVPVVGNSSCGITSSAVSLAKLLSVNNRVMLIDMDMLCTDMESRLGDGLLNPLVRVEGVSVDDGRNSAMGIIATRGVDFFIQHHNEIVIRVSATKGGLLDYMPGYYTRPDAFSAASIDYAQLFSYLLLRGSYKYVVVDCGKIGASVINDQIISNICEVGYRTLFVSDGDYAKVRGLNVKLKSCLGAAGRSIWEGAVWLLNRSMQTKIDLKVKNAVTPAIPVSIPIVSDMVGRYTDFTESSGGKRHFARVIEALGLIA
jgi:hypothetical protein